MFNFVQFALPRRKRQEEEEGVWAAGTAARTAATVTCLVQMAAENVASAASPVALMPG